MKITQIIQETTTAGSVAPVEHSFVKMQTRNPSVYGGNKVGNLLKGKKTNKPFGNSLNEAAMKDLAYDLQNMKSAEFQKKYGKSREEMKAAMSKQPQPQKPTPPVNEADLSEQDLIVVPGQGRLKKSGFVKHDPDKSEHEGETLKNSLHTIVRVASHLDKELSTRDNFPEWVSEKIGAVKSNMVTVMDYLISAKEMQTDPDAMNEGNDRVDSLVTDSLKLMRGPEVADAVKALKTVLGDREYNSRRGHYNFFIRQMLDAYGQKGATESLGTTGAMTNGEMGESQLDELSPKALGSYVKSASGDMAKRTGDTQFQKGARVATSAFNSKLPASRFEKDAKIEKRQAGINRAVDKMANEGAKVDRMVKHVAQSEKKLGHSKKEAENIAWATANKRGMLDNKNKKK